MPPRKRKRTLHSQDEAGPSRARPRPRKTSQLAGIQELEGFLSIRIERGRGATSVTTNDTMLPITDAGHMNWLSSIIEPSEDQAELSKSSLDLDLRIEDLTDQLQWSRVASVRDTTERMFLPLGKLLEILPPSVVRKVLNLFFHDKPVDWVSEVNAKIYANGKPETLKIMATLLLMEKLDWLPRFTENNIGDSKLPLRFQQGGLPMRRRCPPILDQKGTELVELDGVDWKRTDVEMFFMKQMELCAPFFRIGDDGGHVDFYQLSGTLILPFLEVERSSSRTGGFGKVEKVRVEPSHLIGCARGTTRPTYLAIKELLHHSSPDHPTEVDALLRRVVVPPESQEHVSRLLFSFRHGNSYFMAFEWADGTLVDLWKQKRFRPWEIDDVLCFFKQCVGMADGLHGIQKLQKSWKRIEEGEVVRKVLQDAHGQHNDIKPDNILFYNDNPSDSSQDSSYLGRSLRLVVADLGCALFSTTEDKSMVRISRLRGITVAYSAPESETATHIEPSYDIWSLGCVFLEHATVFLEGNIKVLDDFADLRYQEDASTHSPRSVYRHTGQSYFLLSDFRGGKTGKKKRQACSAVVKKSVKKWIRDLLSHGHCSRAMTEFLHIIRDKMLVVDTTQRFQTQELLRALNPILLKCQAAEDDYACSSIRHHQKPEATSHQDGAFLGTHLPDTGKASPELLETSAPEMAEGLFEDSEDSFEEPEDSFEEVESSIPEPPVRIDPEMVPGHILASDPSPQVGLQEKKQKIESLGRQITSKGGSS